MCISIVFLAGDPPQYQRVHNLCTTGTPLSHLFPVSTLSSDQCPVFTLLLVKKNQHRTRYDTWMGASPAGWRTFIFTNQDGATQKRLHLHQASPHQPPCFPFLAPPHFTIDSTSFHRQLNFTNWTHSPYIAQ